MAHGLILTLGLGAFYTLPVRRAAAPVATATARLSPEDFASPAFLTEFTAPLGDGRRRATLALSALRCYACVWLCEGAMRRVAPEAAFDVNLETGVATVAFDPVKTSLGVLADTLTRLGYAPVPLAPGALPPPRDDLLRLGVAAFCTLNVMSFSAADYLAGPGGLEIGLWQLFRWLGLALATFAFFYAARPLLVGAWRAAVARRVVIDQPLVLAMLSAYGFSAYDTVRGAGPVYFDSVVAVLALVLAGRYLQTRLFLRVERSLGRSFDPSEDLARLVTDDGVRLAPLRDLLAGQAFMVPPGALVPADAVVTSGGGEVSRAPLTGEPKPVTLRKGDAVSGGVLNGPTVLYCTATADALSCYARRARVLARRMMDEKGRMSALCDRLAAAFFGLTLAVAAAAFFAVVRDDPAMAVTRAVAVLLVACPCVFGFAAPLAFATCAARGLERGVVFRSQRAVEQLAAARRFVFDKTGTLTLGRPQVVESHWFLPALAATGLAQDEVLAALVESRGLSDHHAARAVAAWAEPSPPGAARPGLEAAAVEQFGAGVTFALVGGPTLTLGKKSHCARGGVDDGLTWLGIDGHLVASFGMDDTLMPDARGVIDWLQATGAAISISSGDQEGRTQAVAAALGLAPEAAEAGRSPAGKALGVRRLKAQGAVAMVGNGVNDAVALGEAPVGVAVCGAMQAAREAADVCLTRPGLAPLRIAVAMSRAATRALRRSFCFASAYNLMAMSLAATGHVTPLVAALLMPVNSLVVTLITTRWRDGAAA